MFRRPPQQLTGFIAKLPLIVFWSFFAIVVGTLRELSAGFSEYYIIEPKVMSDAERELELGADRIVVDVVASGTNKK